MKAAILTQIGAPLDVVDLQVPPLQVGHVLVRMQYAAICGAQLNEQDGTKGPDRYLPHLIGHEGCGEVIAIGPGVTTKQVGDQVICHWRPSEGIAAKGPVYDCHGTNVNAGPMACFATECVVSENRLTLCPDWIQPRVAPLFGCALLTSYGVITRDAQVKPGDHVLVFGCGGVGMAIIQMLQLIKTTVIAVDPVPEKRTQAERYCTYATTSPPSGPYDVVIDTTGKSKVIEAAYRLTAQRGKTILVGVPNVSDPIAIDSLPLHFGKLLKGSHGGDAVPHEDIPRIAAFGELNFEELITHEFPLDQINDAFDLVRSGSAGRVLLRMDA